MLSLIRKSATYLMADVVGYSRLISFDPDKTVRMLRVLRQKIIDPEIMLQRGRILRTVGDGLLVEFEDPQDAVTCAIRVQGAVALHEELEQRLTLRIGVNCGEVIADGSDLHGETINVAARLQEMAEPGAIYLTSHVREKLTDKMLIELRDVGEPVLRGISAKFRVFAIDRHSSGVDPERVINHERQAHRSSLAVLPFENISGNSIEEYFVDGMTDEIIMALSCIPSLLVVARNSTFLYKGRRVDTREIGRSLGVRYIVEGSVRRAENRVRITAQLTEAEGGTNIWAGRFEGAASEVLSLQDQVAAKLAGLIEPKIETVEIERARRKSLGNLNSYDFYLRALPHRAASTREDNREALRLLRLAISADPKFAPALAHASMCITAMRNQGYERDVDEVLVRESLQFAELAIAADPNDPTALTLAGHTLAALAGEYDRGQSLIERSLAINSNSAESWARSAMVRNYRGDLETAIVHAHRSLELNPLDPSPRIALCAIAYAHLFAKRFDEAMTWARRALVGLARPEMAYRISIAAGAHLGKVSEIQSVKSEFLKRYPNFRVSEWAGRDAFRDPDQIATMEAGLRIADLPE